MAFIFRCKAATANGGKWFCNIIICSDLIAAYLVALLVVGGQEDHYGVWASRFYEPAQVKAAAVGEVDVQQRQVKFPLSDSLRGSPEIHGGSHAVAVRGQVIHKHSVQKAVVLDDQELLHILTFFAVDSMNSITGKCPRNVTYP